jgi:hypothetical protein
MHECPLSPESLAGLELEAPELPSSTDYDVVHSEWQNEWVIYGYPMFYLRCSWILRLLVAGTNGTVLVSAT